MTPVGATNPVLAALSKVAFDALINPALNTAYTSVARGAFVNVTTAPPAWPRWVSTPDHSTSPPVPTRVR